MFLEQPIFMAPEVFKGKYNEKCDLWSCGVILYVLLSGRLPFTGKTRQETTIQILNGHYTTTGNQWKKVSLEAIDFLKKLLCYDPKERYSAEQALNDPWILRHNGGNIAAEPLATEALENLKLFRVIAVLLSSITNITGVKNKRLRRNSKRFFGCSYRFIFPKARRNINI